MMATKRRRPARLTPKPRVRRSSAGPPATPADVVLVPTKGTEGRGGGKEGEAWRIDAWGQRAGTVFTNIADEPAIGRHASIQIFLNIDHQGRRIGSIAYRKACQASRHDVIYAHMRKSNVASIRAAENAGFVDATPNDHIQKVMVWRRSST
jgi:RimJ/RimL family protein N-acetyltransferase